MVGREQNIVRIEHNWGKKWSEYSKQGSNKARNGQNIVIKAKNSKNGTMNRKHIVNIEQEMLRISR